MTGLNKHTQQTRKPLVSRAQPIDEKKIANRIPKDDERWLQNARNQLNKRIQTPKAWTPREITILREYYGKVLAKDLAKIIGRPLGSILKKARLLGLKSGLSFAKPKPNT